MSDWKEVCSEQDIEEITATFRDFHDSCIVSVNYFSGAFVDEDGAMHFGSDIERKAVVFFHNQWEPKSFELCFSGIRQMHIVGWQDNYSCNIEDAELSFYRNLLPGEPDKLIVWTDGNFEPDKAYGPLHESADTYIVASKLKWRIV